MKLTVLLLAILLCVRVSSSSAGAESEAPRRHACEREMARAAARHGVPLAILYGVGLAETGRGDGLRPHALNIAGDSVYDLDRQEALDRFAEARRRGVTSIDVGCMQINYRYHGKKFASVEEMFDPAANVDYAARFLKELHGQEGDWTRAVARYHAGIANKPAQKRYVCAVIKRLVTVGLGAETEESRALCRPAATSRRVLNGWRTSVIPRAAK